MECCMDNATKEQKHINKEIEKQLRKDKKNAYKRNTVLLLGGRGSGKSTFVKQMRIIYGIGYSDEDKKNFIRLIYQNIFEAMQIMINIMKYQKIKYKDSSNHENADLICSVDPETVTTIENQFADAIKALWNDPSIQKCYDWRKCYAWLELSDSAKYFLNDLDQIVCSDYLPSQEDILRVYVRNSKIMEYIFHLDSCIFEIFDVAGERNNNRRKWMYCFGNATSIIFFADLSDYDQIQEDEKDLLEEKIMVSHLVDYFPEYDGPKQDYIAAREFILKMYLSENADTGRVIYPHFTSVIDTEDVRSVFASVKDTILQENLKNHKLKRLVL